MEPTPVLSPRKTALLQAALEVLAAHGLRGLTHRAVDRRAGLPEGSCSAYFRTRGALQSASARYLADRLLSDVEELAGRVGPLQDDHEEAVRLTAELFDRWTGPGSLIPARWELVLEARRDPELAVLLRGSWVRLTDVVELVLAAREPAGAGERAATLVAAFDGVLLASLLVEDRERASFLHRSVGQLLSAAPAPSPREER